MFLVWFKDVLFFFLFTRRCLISCQLMFLCCPMVALSIIILSLSEKVMAFRNSSTKFKRLSSDCLLRLVLA